MQVVIVEDDELPCVIGESKGDCIWREREDQWEVCSIEKLQHT